MDKSAIARSAYWGSKIVYWLIQIYDFCGSPYNIYLQSWSNKDKFFHTFISLIFIFVMVWLEQQDSAFIYMVNIIPTLSHPENPIPGPVNSWQGTLCLWRVSWYQNQTYIVWRVVRFNFCDKTNYRNVYRGHPWGAEGLYLTIWEVPSSKRRNPWWFWAPFQPIRAEYWDPASPKRSTARRRNGDIKNISRDLKEIWKENLHFHHFI